MTAPPLDDGVSVDSSRGHWVIGIAVVGSGMAFLDGTVVNVALPDIGRDLHATTSELQWILNSYLLTLASLILLGGSLGDRYGRRCTFVWGIVVFAGASLLCGIAPNVKLLILARLLQGIGGALLTPGSLALIETCFRRGERAKAVSIWSGLGAVAAAIGPLVGGYLVSALSWRAIFFINLPIGVFTALAATRYIPETRDPTAEGRLDFAGAGLGALGLAATTYALVQASVPSTRMVTLAAAVLGVTSLFLFFLHERSGTNPLLPLDVFASRQFSATNVVTFVVYAALGGFFFLFVSFLQISLGYTPVEAGAASLPVTLLMLFFSPRAGALAQRLGARMPLAVGSLVIAAGLLAMVSLSPGASYPLSVLPPILVFGVGLTLVVAPGTAAALASADATHSGIASGVNNAVARIAGLLAVAVLPLAVGITGDGFYDSAKMTSGFHAAMIVCALLAAIAGVLAWLTIDPRILDTEAVGTDGDTPERVAQDYACPVNGPPLRPGREAKCEAAESV